MRTESMNVQEDNTKIRVCDVDFGNGLFLV